jgi:hypothetical protein
MQQQHYMPAAPPPYTTPPMQQQPHMASLRLNSPVQSAAALAVELGVDSVTAQRVADLQQQKQQVGAGRTARGCRRSIRTDIRHFLPSNH